MFKYLKFSLLLLMLTTIVPNSAPAECPIGDLDNNCRVNLEDLRIFAEQWLGGESMEANFDGSSNVDMPDYAMLAENWLKRGIPLRINEFMASNNSVYEDPDNPGEYSDWIEIYNAGDETIDMSGMYLTDNLENPTQWQIPGGVSLTSGAYLVILADLLDYQGIALHTNFKLGAGGEQIGLFHSNGTTEIDSIDFDQINQYTDISYGLDANDALRFFGVPTPVAENNDAYLGLVADTTFSRDRGFYDASFDVEIECDTPGADIYYSLDFSKPDQITGTEYTSPISVTGTTCIRAMAFKPGWKPTNVDTHTYIFLDDVIAQDTAQALARGFPDPWEHLEDPYEFLTSHPSDYDMQYENPPGRLLVPDMATLKAALKDIPTMSIVVDMNDAFNKDIGFYVNSWLKGVAWEREASVEYFDANGIEEFQENCGIRAQGNQNRRPYRTPKHSMRIRFKNDYGPTKLRYAIFKDSPVDTFDSLTLRGGCGDSWHVYGSRLSSYTRDAWGHTTLHEVGLAAPYGNYVHLYFNGLYWGLYNPVERPDAPFYAEHMGGDEEDWEANNAGLPIGEDTPADLVVWNTISGMCAGGTLNDTQYDEMSQWLDMPAFCDYLLVYFYGGVGDWGTYNFYAAAMQTDPGQPPEIGLRFSTWDFEESLGLWGCNPNDNNTNVADKGDVGVSRILRDLEGNAKFQKLFGDRAYKWLYNDGPLTNARCIERWEGLNVQIEKAIYGEIVRWGDVDNTTWPVGQDEWEQFQANVTNNWLAVRRDILISQLRSRSLYPSIDPPIYSQHGGYVTDGYSLTMTNPNGSGTIYYTVDGNDPSDGGGGGSTTYTTLINEGDPKKAFVPGGSLPGWNDMGFDDSGWNHGLPETPGKTGGVGFDTSPDYHPYITYDVETEMDNTNATCYVRIPFSVAGDPGDFDILTLKLRYDDGFVAYINGVEA
ncbi:MAG: chitobiase/beta-hexosaminidase C-terminal domain-containing protein, partial [Planctomycetota bacterium]